MPLKLEKKNLKTKKFQKMLNKYHIFELVDGQISFCVWIAIFCKSLKKKKNEKFYTILALFISRERVLL